MLEYSLELWFLDLDFVILRSPDRLHELRQHGSFVSDTHRFYASSTDDDLAADTTAALLAILHRVLVVEGCKATFIQELLDTHEVMRRQQEPVHLAHCVIKLALFSVRK